MLTKLLAVNFRMSAAAYCIEREREREREREHSSTRKSHSFDICRDCTVQAECYPCQRDTAAEVLVTKYHELLGNLLEFFY